MNQCKHYHELVSGLARQAMGMAVDARPHRPRAGEAVWSMLGLMPAAEVLLGDEPSAGITALEKNFAAANEARRPRFTDGLGHSRAVYHPLALHLYLAAGGEGDMAWGRKETGGEPGGDIALGLWWALCRWELGEAEAAAATVDTTIGAMGKALGDDPAPLHALGVDDPLDTWTYRELAGLHALHRLAQASGRADWRARVAAATAYHQGHTQPDYTTYQPWSLAAFVGDDTTLFADQQLHDTATHLAVVGGPGAALPAVLLADAAAMLRTSARQKE